MPYTRFMTVLKFSCLSSLSNKLHTTVVRKPVRCCCKATWGNFHLNQRWVARHIAIYNFYVPIPATRQKAQRASGFFFTLRSVWFLRKTSDNNCADLPEESQGDSRWITTEMSALHSGLLKGSHPCNAFQASMQKTKQMLIFFLYEYVSLSFI